MKRLLFCALVVPVVAVAHAVDHPRQLLMRATPTELEVRFTLELDPTQSKTTRRLFDRDRNGRLEGSEAVMLGGYLERRAVGAFELRRGGKAVPPTSTRRELHVDDDPRTNLAARVTLVWKLSGAKEQFSVWDEGDGQGHVPVTLEPAGADIRFGGVKLGNAYDLPSNVAVSLVLRRVD